MHVSNNAGSVWYDYADRNTNGKLPFEKQDRIEVVCESIQIAVIKSTIGLRK